MVSTLQQIVSTLTGIVLALQATLGGVPATQVAQVTPTATITLSPSSNSVSVNGTFTVNIVLNTGGQNAYGADVNRLRFNPSILQVVDSDVGTAGVQIGAGSLMPLTIINSVDNTGGSIQFSQLASPGSTFSGSGTLATVTFRAISAGTSGATFDFTLGSGTDSNVAGLGGDLLASVGSGSYTGVTLDTTAPTISSITSSGITQTGATITWTTNENSDTQVEYGLTTSYGASTAINTSMVTSHSATLSGLSAGTVYNYRVRSRDAAGNLATSANNTFITSAAPDTTAPTAPGTPTLTVLSSSQINLSWTASTDAVGVTGYRVERCSGSATCTTYTQIATPTTNSYSDTGLTASTIYRYRVRAVDAAGNLSAYSNASNATTQAPPDTTPPTISGVTLSGITQTGATISWTTNESADTQVDYGPTASYGFSTTLITTLSTSHSATISGLSAGTVYNYRVKSRDAAGNLATSVNNTFTTLSAPDTTAPSVPTGLTATPTSENQIQISWTASTDAPGSGQSVSGIYGYQIFRDGSLIATTSATAYLNTGLTAGTSFSYQVASVDNANNVSARSSSVGATTPIFSLSVQRRVVIVPEGAPSGSRNITGTLQFLNPLTSTEVYQASFTADNTGSSTISVPSGLPPTVNFRSIVLGYLSKIISNIDLRNTVVLSVTFPTLPGGDFNGDQIINSIDFSYMNSRWGASDTLSDLNRDGAVNSLDFAYLSNNWMLEGE